MITRDNVPARVDAVAYFRVVDADASVVDIEDHLRATSEIAKTTLRSVLGKAELDTLLSERERLNEDLQRIIDEQTESWGIKVLTVEIKDVVIPQEMQRAMARQAEAERDRRAKVINAEAEFQAAARLAEAARMLSDPGAMQLRYLQTLAEVGKGEGSTVLLPMPLDVTRLRRQRRSAQRPPWRNRRHEAVTKMQVLIAGAGPAGVEAALTLQRIGGNRFDTTIVAPEERFVHLPPAVLSPFAAAVRGRPRLEAQGARVRRSRVIAVDADAREVQLDDGATLPYDALLIAVGGIARSPYPRALAFGLPGSEERMHGLIQDLEDGYVRRIAFVVPPGASWPLPIYELALMTAERAFDMCAKAELTFVTPEPAPLAVFGEEASADVAVLLAEAGISVRTGADADMPRCNALELRPTGERLEVDRVVTVPILSGPAIDGLPHDVAGFLPVDSHGRVNGVAAVYAAGDVTDFEIKQGGLACQQADAAAHTIAADAGLPIVPAPFAPRLRGALVTERHIRGLQRDLAPAGGDVEPLSSSLRTKFFGRELSPLLDDVPVRVR